MEDPVVDVDVVESLSEVLREVGSPVVEVDSTSVVGSSVVPALVLDDVVVMNPVVVTTVVPPVASASSSATTGGGSSKQPVSIAATLTVRSTPQRFTALL